VLFSDVDLVAPGGNLTAYVSEEFTLHTKLTSIHRPHSFDAVKNARHRSMKFGQSILLDWEEDEIAGPDTESRETLLEIAKMTSNAYLQPSDKGWYSLGENWTTVRLTLTLILNDSFITHVGI
jgi:lipase ATG15